MGRGMVVEDIRLCSHSLISVTLPFAFHPYPLRIQFTLKLNLHIFPFVVNVVFSSFSCISVSSNFLNAFVLQQPRTEDLTLI